MLKPANPTIIKSLFTFSMLLALTACGAGNGHLPDEPDNEPTLTETNGENLQSRPPVVKAPSFTQNEAFRILSKYDHVDPKHQIRDSLLRAALLFYDQNASMIKNKAFLSVIDFSLSSKQARFFIIEMKSGSVWAIHTAHGKGSDANGDGMAEKFSNTSGSDASSIGFYLTAETYSGKHGLSLRMDGLSSTNSNVRARAVVIHGASYVQESSVIQGRSWGCPAVTMTNRDRVVNSLKGGSLIYANKN